MWLRGLVAVTCAAVLAAVGYFFWIEHQRSDNDARLAEIADGRRACLLMLDRYANRRADDPDAEEMLSDVNDCVDSLLLAEDDINAAISRRDAMMAGN